MRLMMKIDSDQERGGGGVKVKVRGWQLGLGFKLVGWDGGVSDKNGDGGGSSGGDNGCVRIDNGGVADDDGCKKHITATKIDVMVMKMMIKAGTR